MTQSPLMADYNGDAHAPGFGLTLPLLMVLAAVLIALALIPFIHPPTRPELHGEMLARLESTWAGIDAFCAVYGRLPETLAETDPQPGMSAIAVRRYEIAYTPTRLPGSVEEARYAVTLSISLPHGYIEPITQQRVVTVPRIEAAHGTSERVGSLRFEGATAITPFRHHGEVVGIFAPPAWPPPGDERDPADVDPRLRADGVITVGTDDAIIWWDPAGRARHRYPATRAQDLVSWLAVWATEPDAEPPLLRVIEVALPNRVLVMRDLATGMPIRRRALPGAVPLTTGATLHDGQFLTAHLDGRLTTVDLTTGRTTPLPFPTVLQFQPDGAGYALASMTRDDADAASGSGASGSNDGDRIANLVRLPVNRYPDDVDAATNVTNLDSEADWAAHDAAIAAWKRDNTTTLQALTLNPPVDPPTISVSHFFNDALIARTDGFVSVLSAAVLPAEWQRVLGVERMLDRTVLFRANLAGEIVRSAVLPLSRVYAIAPALASANAAPSAWLLIGEAEGRVRLVRVSVDFETVEALHDLGPTPSAWQGAVGAATRTPQVRVRGQRAYLAWGSRVVALDLSTPAQTLAPAAAGGPLAFTQPGTRASVITASGTRAETSPDYIATTGALATGRLKVGPMDGAAVTERVVAVAGGDGSLRLVDPRRRDGLDALMLPVVAPRAESPPPVACSRSGHVVFEARVADAQWAIAIANGATVLSMWAGAHEFARANPQTQPAATGLHPRVDAALADARDYFGTSHHIILAEGERLLAVTTGYAPLVGTDGKARRVEVFVAITGDLSQRSTASRVHWGLVSHPDDLREEDPSIPILMRSRWEVAGPDLLKRTPGDDLVRPLVERYPRWPVRWLTAMDWRGDVSVGPHQIAFIDEMGTLRCFDRHYDAAQTQPDADSDNDGAAATDAASERDGGAAETIAASEVAFAVTWYEFQTLPFIDRQRALSVRYSHGAVPFAATRALVPDVGHVVLASTMGQLRIAPLDANAAVFSKLKPSTIRLAARAHAFAALPGIALYYERLDARNNRLAVAAAGRVILYSTAELAAALASQP